LVERVAAAGSQRPVAVVGAGYAGMAAAVTLAGGGLPVTVFESGPVPGGRARRVTTAGRTLDNGQHILVGAYAELLRLMRAVGVPDDALLRLPLELRYADGFAFRARRLPGRLGPLGVLAGLLACRRLPVAEGLGTVRFMMRLRRLGFRVAPAHTVATLLAEHRQDGVAGRYLWRPLCVSALNTPPELASAQVFANVLRDSLAGGPGASDLLLPRVDLSRLFPEPACEFVAARGGDIRMGTTVRNLDELRRAFGAIIVAVGPHQLRALLPGSAPSYDYQPIVTCTLQYPEPVSMPFPMLGLMGGLVQWIFDRDRLNGEAGRIACVISAQGDHQRFTHDALAAVCHREVAAALGRLPAPQWTQVIAEKRATPACTPGMAHPAAATPLPGVFLAGDFTDPDYPPTLEAAVRSGIRAANVLLGNA
jgi:squalene-associated FAD-dependent desaturase